MATLTEPAADVQGEAKPTLRPMTVMQSLDCASRVEPLEALTIVAVWLRKHGVASRDVVTCGYSPNHTAEIHLDERAVRRIFGGFDRADLDQGHLSIVDDGIRVVCVLDSSESLDRRESEVQL